MLILDKLTDNVSTVSNLTEPAQLPDTSRGFLFYSPIQSNDIYGCPKLFDFSDSSNSPMQKADYFTTDESSHISAKVSFVGLVKLIQIYLI